MAFNWGSLAPGGILIKPHQTQPQNATKHNIFNISIRSTVPENIFTMYFNSDPELEKS